jgi:cytochrome c-type biogenesis protein CcmF
MNFTGEHLAIGNLGNLAIELAFTLSILSAISYFFNATQRDASGSWLKIARTSFLIQCASVLTVFVSLFYIIYHHYFEYHYAWAHSSTTLPTRYMISCFWEGQEGSFLLWIIWQALLGALLIWKIPRSWEAPVMVVISVSQVMLTSMILGVVIGDFKLGSSPFTLLRNAMLDAPIFKEQNYLEFIKDGNGLNPLLQNYWMVIHPPTLFFGFASTVVPFAFAFAGLWQKRYGEWVKPAMAWAGVSLCVLGTGIIMGAAWAYESLSFGGYWNWDPVENASIIPWLVMVAALHTMMIYKSTGKSLHTVNILVLLTFLLVLYATFLTRSGILGDSSVHSFTDLGLSGQLLLWLFLFIGITVFLVIRTWRSYSSAREEDNLSSREFWMFIGALVLLLSAIHIAAVTSIPVYNKLAALFNYNLKLAPPSDRYQAYHLVQIPIAILITLGTAFGQYLKFKKTVNMKSFYIKMGIHLAIAFIAGSLIYYYAELNNPVYGFLMISSIFAFTANLAYIFDGMKLKLKATGHVLAHTGFAMMLIGVIFSSVNKNVISENRSGPDLGDEKANAENVFLEKNHPTRMKDYLVTYLGDSSAAPDIFYKVNYKKMDEMDRVVEEFTLHPNAQINPKMGLIANPDTKHYLSHDVFTHVTSVPKNEQETNDTAGIKNVKTYWVNDGDTIHANNTIIVYQGSEDLTNSPKNKVIQANALIGAVCKVYTNRGETFTLEPIFGFKRSGESNEGVYIDDRSKEAGIVLGFLSLDPNNGKIQLGVGEKTPERDFIIMKAIVFPYINILWAGAILFAIGSFISFVRRMRMPQS